MHAKPVTIPATDQMLANTPRLLYGWSVHESDAVPAVASFLLRNGSVSGQVVAAVELLANASETKSFAHPVYVDQGIFVDVVGGVFEGSIYVS